MIKPMKLLSYLRDGRARVAVARDDGIVDVNEADPELPSCIKQILAGGPEMFARVGKAVATAASKPLDEADRVPPIPSPEKIVCVGLNYADHAREGGREPPEEPIIFGKYPSAVLADGQSIELPPLSQQVDYEAELVAVIGRPGRNIPEDRAAEHVAAYCCGNDISARDWQFNHTGGQWLLGKTFDTFAPFGPYLVTADEVLEPENLSIRLRLNGEVMQDSSTAHLIFSIPRLIAHVSQFFTLKPGDLLFTGTPPGVGFARDPQVFLKPGDRLEVEIDGLGMLSNPVVAAAAK
jgi:2-keto-4-pentenoate hydratase/2-oxohepta-3-ene-1,7-dioic acid hydratase in catechol pathway